MKKIFVLFTLTVCILFNSFSGCAAYTFDNHVEGAKTGCDGADLSIIPSGTDIDALTTTSVNPWKMCIRDRS